jgi:hypothetical protein
MLQNVFLLALICTLAFIPLSAQDTQELEAEKAASSKLKGEHPLMAIARSKPSSLRRDLVGVHPRV